MNSPAIKILGTMKDGTFISSIQFEGRTIYAYYPVHIGDILILHTFPDYVTRFAVFYENDESMHFDCISILERDNLTVEDKSDSGLVELFRKAIAQHYSTRKKGEHS